MLKILGSAVGVGVGNDEGAGMGNALGRGVGAGVGLGLGEGAGEGLLHPDRHGREPEGPDGCHAMVGYLRCQAGLQVSALYLAELDLQLGPF